MSEKTANIERGFESYISREWIKRVSPEEVKRRINVLESAFREGRLIPFIGAGASVICGISLWDDVMRDIEKNVTEVLGVSCGYKERLESKIGEICVQLKENRNNKSEKVLEMLEKVCDVYFAPGYKDNIRRASEIWDICKRRGKLKGLLGILEKAFAVKHHSTTITLVKLVRVFNEVITVNYDETLENAWRFISKTETVEKIPWLESYRAYGVSSIKYGYVNRNKSLFSIFHIHGVKNDFYSQEFVFTEEQYDKYYSGEIRDFLSQIVRDYSLLFIGFSFEDYKFRKLFLDVLRDLRKGGGDYSEFVSEHRPHFLFLDENVYFERIDKQKIHFEKNKIEIMVYNKNEHIFIEKLLDHLHNIRFSGEEM